MKFVFLLTTRSLITGAIGGEPEGKRSLCIKGLEVARSLISRNKMKARVDWSKVSERKNGRR